MAFLESAPQSLPMAADGSVPTCLDADTDAIMCDLSNSGQLTVLTGSSTLSSSTQGDDSDTVVQAPKQIYIATATDKDVFLRLILKEFVDKVSPARLIDSMISAGCLTLSDNESLYGSHVHYRRDQARKLWTILNSLSVEDFNTIVIPELLESYSHIIPCQFFTPKRRESETGEDLPPLCLRHSLMRARVTTLADSLCHCGSLTLQQYNQITQCRQCRSDSEVWHILFQILADQCKSSIDSEQMVIKVLSEELQHYRLQVPQDLPEQVKHGVPCTCRLPDHHLPPGAPPLQSGGQTESCNRHFQSAGSQYLGSDGSDIKLPEPDPEFKAWADKGGLSETTFMMLLKEEFTSITSLRGLPPSSLECYLPDFPRLPGKQRLILENLIRGLNCADDIVAPKMSDLLSDVENKVRLLVVGKTGAGKSTLGNSLLGRDAFKTSLSMSSTTTDYQFACSEDEKLEVMDLPGLFDTRLSVEELCTKLAQAIIAMAPQPSAVLYTIAISSHYTDEEFETYQSLKRIFGKTIYRHMIVVFTRGDDLKKSSKSIKEYIQGAPDRFKNVLQECGSRYVVFDNTPDGRNQEQLAELKRKVLEIMERDDNEEGCSDLEIFSIRKEELLEEILRRMREQGSYKAKISILKEGEEENAGQGGIPNKRNIFWEIWIWLVEWLKRVCRFN